MRRVNVSLHDLCQPLTTLQCRLELAMMTDTMEGYREAAELGLVECRRLVAAVNQMREIVRSVAEATEIERKE
jgi:signal transduction histidine kinase